MEATLELEDLDGLIEDLETRVNEIRLPDRGLDNATSLIAWCTVGCTDHGSH
ncbi:hypothetical protein LX15_002455 [Streptoalloteichus tenebrarius]|uniref:Uncharacterized protein n=1 Tax=Streptoalloteichus tenebrarius (strain ATCC 17920 / DSM 40477 / JCM 4838 / CBS 697.72 / NBRC 16177 / NCIMB 11028 / NRRL B-12390 / A12253. 1 / ISP 5477) TaxID=1933 RepID=A0ABT1HTC9_STRSD|nr:hypothetical protein [Streptoalloteichus tenebrarius]MCP2258757.1 hypothetical protein [Streptoalloteichus tenebrarius]BFF02911.1 hypothetical protein GCM10020241_45860 [Streptoalloteichus tenebrarius]